MVNPEKTFTSKLGTTRAGERTRIWLEGNRLIAHGFNRGECVHRKWDAAKLTLALVDRAIWETRGTTVLLN